MNKNVYNDNSEIYLNYGYLMLPINLSVVSQIKIGPETYFTKNGYHVSLLSLENFSIPDQKKVLDFARKKPIKIEKITNTFRIVTKENLQSIIVRVQLVGLKKLIAAVNKHFGYKFVYPPTHITLFTLKNQFGIAVNSTGEYRQLTRQISQKDSQRLAKSYKLIN